MLAEDQMEDQKSEEDKQKEGVEIAENNFSSPDFKRGANNEPFATA